MVTLDHLVLLAVTASALVTVAWLLQPLRYREDELQPVRKLGPDSLRPREPHSESEPEPEPDSDVDPLPEDERYCLNCGSSVDQAFTYCGQCLTPLP